MAKAKQTAKSDVTDAKAALAAAINKIKLAVMDVFIQGSVDEEHAKALTHKAAILQTKSEKTWYLGAIALRMHTDDPQMARDVAAACYSKHPQASSYASRVKALFTALGNPKLKEGMEKIDELGGSVWNMLAYVSKNPTVAIRRGKIVKIARSAGTSGGSGGSNRLSPLEAYTGKLSVILTGAETAKLLPQQILIGFINTLDQTKRYKALAEKLADVKL